ncbi:hypothetical protein G1K97_12135 [Tenacibaculum finnmarkense]|uniref:hypothetical protein n=1 Tax=Tenacibaculum finnmarkense TaxID=2781243 RepID=UPI001EFC02CA|nr:hypothetical protein [Tenacibaculum finnmarkense]MCG8894396.1 hypothetical protein [Tenacibaculum finnmarkense]MCG8902585.1 hypothetical protein [Tenacibaculum finnmarkense]
MVPFAWEKKHSSIAEVPRYFYLKYESEEFPRAYYTVKINTKNETDKKDSVKGMRVSALMLKVAKTLQLKNAIEGSNAVVLGEELTRSTKKMSTGKEAGYYIFRTGVIKIKKEKEIIDYSFFFENKEGGFTKLYTLKKNSHGLLKFPDSGKGFNRYGGVDKGGKDHGAGDHYLLAKTVAAIFGVIGEIKEKGWEIHLGDMSSEDGKDPWQPGSVHHSGHGGKKGRKGLDIDFRYLDTKGVSYQGKNNEAKFSKEKNKDFFKIAYKYGFGKNYCTNMKTVLGENVLGTKHILYHEDHGHLGLSNQKIEKYESI